MIDKTVNFLQDIELLKKIEPIAERMGLARDGYLCDYDKLDRKCIVFNIKELNHFLLKPKTVDKTYTSSSLELLLPEISIEVNFPDNMPYSSIYINGKENHSLQDSLICEIQLLLKKIIESKGKQKVEALARLIILLEEEGLLTCQYQGE